MKVAIVLALTIVLAVVLLGTGSPVPGFGGLPDLNQMGHGFGARIGNIIKGNTYDGFERAMKKLTSNRHTSASSESSASSDDSSDDSSSMFGFSGKQFEQLISMLQQSKQPEPAQQAVPYAAIDNSVD